MKPTLAIAICLAVSATCSFAQPTLPGVAASLDSFIAAKEIAGDVILVADKDGIRHLSASGMANIAESKPMTTDTVFWIASMTKPVTGTAVMIMQEAGLLKVDDPVDKYLPEFKNLKDATGNPVTITIAQCLAHTAGLTELSPDEDAKIRTLAELTALVVTKPVKFAPGSQWTYSQTGINTAARVVEVVSGQTIDVFFQKRLFEPLGMVDTTFTLTAAQAERLSGSYKRTEAGELEVAPIAFLASKSPTDPNRYPRANGGLFSTATDYSKFARMILRRGELDGKRYLKPESISEMTAVHTGDLKAGFVPGTVYGLGWGVVREPLSSAAALSAGSFGHGGAHGTQGWIDPVKGRVSILMIQRQGLGNGDLSDIRRQFQEATAK